MRGASRLLVFAGLIVCAACRTFGSTGPAPETEEALEAGAPGRDARAPAPSVDGGPYMAAVLADRPVAYFRLDEAAGSTSILDEVTHERIGAPVGAPAFGVAGLVDVGRAVRFGGNDCITLGDRYGFATRAPFTIEVWAQRDAGNFFGHLFTKQDRTPNRKDGYALTTPQHGYQLERFVTGQKDGRKSPQTDQPTSTDVWHLAATYDGSFLELFRNGMTVGNSPADEEARAHDVPAVIGAASPACDFGFEGVIDELAIFDKTLSAEQIQAHFEAGRGSR